MQSYRDYSPITVMMMSSLAIACRTLLPPVTVTVHVYVPSSWSARGLMVRLAVWLPPEPLAPVTEYRCSGMPWSPLHEVSTLSPLPTLESSVTLQVRVRAVPAYRVVVRLGETSTPGWGTGWEGGRDVSHAVNQLNIISTDSLCTVRVELL